MQTKIAERFGIPVSEEDEALLADSVGEWPAFADTPGVLKRLKKTHSLAVISNVDRVSFTRTARHLQVELDAVVTADEVGAYKPDLKMFERTFEILEGMGITQHEILHVAQSLYHDHVPAKQLGLKTVWVNRRHGVTGRGATMSPEETVTPDLEVNSLDDLLNFV